MIGAIDIGGTKISVGVIDVFGKILVSQDIPTVNNDSPMSILGHVSLLLATLAKRIKTEIDVIGISCTGPIDPIEGTVGKVDLLPGWEGINLVKYFSDQFGVPVVLENDADSAALGNWSWEFNQIPQSYALVSVGTGIGVGLILNGKIYRGVNHLHPELGHHVIDASGPLCYCGAHGCWESLASGRAMEKKYQDLSKSLINISARQICINADKGELCAKETVEITAKYLGIGLANIITFLTPEVIVLSGGLFNRFDLFGDVMFTTIQKHCRLVPSHLTKIIPVQKPQSAGLIGAGRVGYEILKR